jgi:hypothetical protein
VETDLFSIFSQMGRVDGLKGAEMKSKLGFLFLLLFPLYSQAQEHTCATNGRCIFATDIYSQIGGDFYIPTVTPLSNRACIFDNNNTITNSITTAIELSYVSGATSNIQAQINALSFGRITNTVTSGSFTFSTLTKDYILNVNSSSIIDVTLPDAVASVGFCADIKEIGTGSINVGTIFSQTVDGFSSDTINHQNQSNRYCAVGGEWFKY